MGLPILTTKELFDRALAYLEARLNQTSPLTDKAFLRVLSVLIATSQTETQRFAAERVLQVFALTATGDDLDLIGNEYKVYRKAAEAAQLQVESTVNTGPVTVPITIDWVGDSNAIRYRPDEETVWPTGTASFSITARTAGIISNLVVSDTLTIDTPLAGMSTIATVTAILNYGADQETDDAYRARILNFERNTSNGGNAFDYKNWAEEVGGVEQAYPYSGAPVVSASLPGDRTVYIQAISEIDSDGIAPQVLLDEVEQNINYDPLTGYARPTLGDVQGNLWVESIARTAILVEIRDIVVAADKIADAKAAIEKAIDDYLRGTKPYVDGLDALSQRNDSITAASVSEKVQDALRTFGGTVGGVGISLVPDEFISLYTLSRGETAKSGGVSYV